MTQSATISLEVFQRRVLPLLQARHATGPALKQAVQEFLGQTAVVDEDGQAVEIDAIATATDDPQDEEVTETQVAQLVQRALARLPRPEARAAAGGSDTDADPVERRHGFKSLGDFALAVHKAAQRGGPVDRRLLSKAPSLYAGEGAGGAGGFLVPAEFAGRIWQLVFAEDSLLSRTNQVPTSRNALTLPVSTATPWGASGVQAYWVDEAGAIPPSRPQFEQRNLRLHKLAALVPASDELLEDAAALEAFIGNEAGKALRYKADDAILAGDGVGKPLGILNSGALVSVAKETDQSAATLLAANIVKMYARMPAASIARAVWLMSQDVLPQLLSMTLGSQPVYLPPSGLAAAPFGTLLGRPILLSQHCPALGDTGDILFADLSQYLALTRAGGIQAASSIHLWFDADLTAFRFTFRLAGAPWLEAPITPANGGAALSPFVALAPRS